MHHFDLYNSLNMLILGMLDILKVVHFSLDKYK